MSAIVMLCKLEEKGKVREGGIERGREEGREGEGEREASATLINSIAIRVTGFSTVLVMTIIFYLIHRSRVLDTGPLTRWSNTVTCL